MSPIVSAVFHIIQEYLIFGLGMMLFRFVMMFGQDLCSDIVILNHILTLGIFMGSYGTPT
jgi:hypothetical protein